jgi:hypothetical protein
VNRRPADVLLLGGLAQQVLESAARAIVPGVRVDTRRLNADPVAERTMASRVDLGDPIKERAVELGQLLGSRLRIHRRKNGSGSYKSK